MEQILRSFIDNSSTFEKSIVLMIIGLLFVFAVQLVFFLIVKFWPHPRTKKGAS